MSSSEPSSRLTVILPVLRACICTPFPPQDFSNTLHAMSVLANPGRAAGAHTGGPTEPVMAAADVDFAPAVRRLAADCQKRMSAAGGGFTPQDVASTALALARLGFKDEAW